MMTTLAEIGAFLVAHEALIQDIAVAIQNGLTEDVLRKLVQDAMVAASDAEMKRELG